ncbi:MAG: ABC transporter permease [Clostridia bacterium]|nr:ABC transporter permease [Clostridia bacterium]
MKSFFALMKLEISGIFSDMFARGDRSAQKKSIGRGAAMIGVMGMLAVMMVIFELRVLDVLINLRSADILLKFLVAASMFMTVMYGILEVLSRLYFSRDIVILSYLPVKNFTLYSARIVGHLIAEIGISALFIIPGTVVFMSRTGFDAGLMLRALAVTIISPAVPVAFCALVSGLISKVPGFWTHKELITTVFSLILVVGAVFISYFSGQLGGSSVDQEALAESITSLSSTFDNIILAIPPVAWAARALTDGGMDMLLMIVASVVSMLLVAVLFSYHYIEDTSRGSETGAPMKKVDMSRTVIHGQSPFKALTKREILEMIRTPAYLVNGLLGPVIMPTMMTVLMIIPFLQIDGGLAEFIRTLGGAKQAMLPICLFITGIMSLMMGMNSVASTAVSREGRRHSLMVSLPADARTMIASKLAAALFFSLVGIIPPPVICAVIIPGFGAYAFLMFLWSALLAFIGAVLGLIIDIGKPRLDWINETKAIKSNMNQIFGLLIFFVVLALDAGAVVLLFILGLDHKLIILIETVLLVLGSALSFLFLKRKAPSYHRIEA